MNSFSEIVFNDAATTYALANTPLFLLRKLQRDQLVHEIRASFTPEQILAELRRVMDLTPHTSEEYVRPYVYLVALSLFQDIQPLKDAAALQNRQQWEWFSYLQDVLYQAFSPTTTASFQAPPPKPGVQFARPDTTDEWTEINVGKVG